VSGGAAWADHVAVQLFLAEQMDPDGHPFAGLRLFLPAPFILSPKNSKALDTGSSDWRVNPGRLMNQLHAQFGAKLAKSTLYDICVAHAFGAKLLTQGRGFHARNKLIAAEAERVLAFTWGADSARPKDGGTAHTWGLALRAIKVHVPLHQLMAHEKAAAVEARPSQVTMQLSLQPPRVAHPRPLLPPALLPPSLPLLSSLSIYPSPLLLQRLPSRSWLRSMGLSARSASMQRI